MASNGTFIIYWIIKFIQELRSTISKKFPKLYFALFLCFNKKNLEKEKLIGEYLDKHSKFLKNFNVICDCNFFVIDITILFRFI